MTSRVSGFEVPMRHILGTLPSNQSHESELAHKLLGKAAISAEASSVIARNKVRSSLTEDDVDLVYECLRTTEGNPKSDEEQQTGSKGSSRDSVGGSGVLICNKAMPAALMERLHLRPQAGNTNTAPSVGSSEEVLTPVSAPSTRAQECSQGRESHLEGSSASFRRPPTSSSTASHSSSRTGGAHLLYRVRTPTCAELVEPTSSCASATPDTHSRSTSPERQLYQTTPARGEEDDDESEEEVKQYRPTYSATATTAANLDPNTPPRRMVWIQPGARAAVVHPVSPDRPTRRSTGSSPSSTPLRQRMTSPSSTPASSPSRGRSSSRGISPGESKPRRSRRDSIGSNRSAEEGRRMCLQYLRKAAALPPVGSLRKPRRMNTPLALRRHRIERQHQNKDVDEPPPRPSPPRRRSSLPLLADSTSSGSERAAEERAAAEEEAEARARAREEEHRMKAVNDEARKGSSGSSGSRRRGQHSHRLGEPSVTYVGRNLQSSTLPPSSPPSPSSRPQHGPPELLSATRCPSVGSDHLKVAAEDSGRNRANDPSAELRRIEKEMAARKAALEKRKEALQARRKELEQTHYRAATRGEDTATTPDRATQAKNHHSERPPIGRYTGTHAQAAADVEDDSDEDTVLAKREDVPIGMPRVLKPAKTETREEEWRKYLRKPAPRKDAEEQRGTYSSSSSSSSEDEMHGRTTASSKRGPMGRTTSDQDVRQARQADSDVSVSSLSDSSSSSSAPRQHKNLNSFGQERPHYTPTAPRARRQDHFSTIAGGSHGSQPHFAKPKEVKPPVERVKMQDLVARPPEYAFSLPPKPARSEAGRRQVNVAAAYDTSLTSEDENAAVAAWVRRQARHSSTGSSHKKTSHTKKPAPAQHRAAGRRPNPNDYYTTDFDFSPYLEPHPARRAHKPTSPSSKKKSTPSNASTSKQRGGLTQARDELSSSSLSDLTANPTLQRHGFWGESQSPKVGKPRVNKQKWPSYQGSTR